MIVITGPSASGKTATCLYLQKHFGIRKVITHTTREMRAGEKNDVDYHFVTDDVFDRMVENDEFVEHVIYNGNQYGTSRKEVRIDKCMAVELGGAKTYHSFNDPKIVIFFMNLDEDTCRQRMLNRGDDPAKVEKRIMNDKAAFRVDDDIKSIVDVNVDTKKHDLSSVAQFIYDKYIEVLKSRGVDYEKELENI